MLSVSDRGPENETSFAQAIVGVMCPDNCVINVMACFAARGDALERIARLTGCRLRGTRGYFYNQLHETQLFAGGKWKVRAMWEAPAGVVEVIRVREDPQ